MPDSSRREIVTLAVLALTAVLSPVSMDMLTPSLPGLSADTGASAQTIELTLYSFLIGYGIAPTLWGPLSDRVGRRPVMFTGMTIYTVSSLAGILADDAGLLIAARFTQGIGGGAGATVARAIVRDIYGAAGTTHGMARLISLMAVVPFFMPLLGGLLADVFSWKACFVAMSLIGLLTLAAFHTLVPESRDQSRGPRSTPGRPVTAILGNRVFLQHSVCNMFCISTLVIFGANFAFLTGQLFRFDSAANGLVLALFNGSIAAGTYLASRLLSQGDVHRSILTGAATCTVGWLAISGLAAAGLDRVALLTLPLVVAGVGSGIIMALCSGAALAPFSHHSGTASSIYLLVQSAGSSGISFAVGLYLPKLLLPIALAMTGCACLAVAIKIALYRPDIPVPDTTAC